MHLYDYYTVQLRCRVSDKTTTIEDASPLLRALCLSAGSPVQVTSYSPFRGPNGIIQAVDTLSGDGEEPFCLYLVDLEGTLTEEPLWFENDEVEVISSPLIALEA